MLRHIVTTCASLVMLGIAVPCNAQIVRFGGFGGVRVRAPFVSVDVGPYGGTRVRAPFTSVYSYGPGIAYGRPYVGVPAFPPVPPFVALPAIRAYSVPVYPVPVVPEIVYEEPAITAEGYQVTRPSLDGHVAEDLRRAAMQLQLSLSQRHDGDVWMTYLDPGRIITSIDQGDAPSALRDLIANYDGVVANRNLRAIYSASGFNTTRELLRVYVDLQPVQPGSSRAVDQPPVAPQPATPVAPATPDAEELPAPNPEPEDRDTTPPPPAPNPPGAAKVEPTEV